MDKKGKKRRKLSEEARSSVLSKTPPSLVASLNEQDLFDFFALMVLGYECEMEKLSCERLEEIDRVFKSVNKGGGGGGEGEEEEREERGEGISRVRNPKTRRKFQVKYIAALLYCRWRPYLPPSSSPAQQFYSQMGGELSYDSLNRLLFGSYHKGDRRVGLWAVVDRQQDGTLRCAYSDEILETADGKRLQKCDEEHLVPQSWHHGSKTHPGQDMHAIFIVSKTANGSRGNSVFGVMEGVPPKKKHGGVTYQEKGARFSYFCPTHNIGAVCRATLYILVCYKQSFHTTYFPPSALKWVVDMAEKEEVSPWEIHRNEELHQLQGTRNPFIDHPKWASLLTYDDAYFPQK